MCEMGVGSTYHTVLFWGLNVIAIESLAQRLAIASTIINGQLIINIYGLIIWHIYKLFCDLNVQYSKMYLCCGDWISAWKRISCSWVWFFILAKYGAYHIFYFGSWFSVFWISLNLSRNIWIFLFSICVSLVV